MRPFVLAVVVSTALSLSAGPPASAAPPPPPAAVPSVTLLTGDVVRFPAGLDGPVDVQPGPGRTGLMISTSRQGQHLYVVPSDAQHLLQSGKLDRRLFDVAELLRSGYEDGKSSELALIVEQPSGRASSLLRTRRSLGVFGAVTASVRKEQATTAWASIRAGAGRKIWLDGKSRVQLDQSVPRIGAPEVWNAGWTGAGAKVAVLDTGIDDQHPDLVGQVVGSRNFTAEEPGDLHGHGTHVAATIASRDATFRGVAPDAKLLAGKVCDSRGECLDSDVLAGMRWAAVENDADVVNLSLGYPNEEGLDLLERGVEELTEQTGTLFVVAAGNKPFGCLGPLAGVSSPASADSALAVGAVDKQDQLADFSCTGPRRGDRAIKPDLTAPGVEIVAAAAGTDGERVTASGTSMAAPHVAGAAAILAGQHPDWSADALKAALMGAAEAAPAPTVFEQGTGRVDVARAVKQSVVVSVGSVSFATQRYPHADDRADSKTVTYRNDGGSDVELSLDLRVRGPNGAPAPAGAMRVDSRTVRVPANGTATVTLTSDTSHEGPDGLYAGLLVASAPGVSVSTAVGVEKELESYDLTVRHVDRFGHAPGGVITTTVFGLDQEVGDVLFRPTSTVRLPKGRYGVSSSFDQPHPDPQVDAPFAILAQPELVLNRDLTIVLDGAKAKPIRVSVPTSSALPIQPRIDFAWAQGASRGYIMLGTSGFGGFTTAGLGRRLPGEFASLISVEYCEADRFDCLPDSPYRYQLAWPEKGRLSTGLDERLTARDLATVTTSYDGTGERAVYFGEGDAATYAMADRSTPQLARAFLHFTELPDELTVYYQPRGIRWQRQFREIEEGGEDGVVTRTEFGTSPRTFRLGTTTSERWNTAPFGPGFPALDSRPFDPEPKPWAARTGDRLSVGLPLFTDANGRAGWFRTDTARTELFRNGTRVAASELAGAVDADVPGGAASYRLEAEADTTSLGTFSTRVQAAWTFRSQRAKKPTALPLAAVRFHPVVDHEGRAKPGQAVVPVSVQRQPGSEPWLVERLAVDVSYDDGKTWERGSLRRKGHDKWELTVRPPAGATYVSLRAKAGGTGGNGVEQTIVRAYGVAAS